MTAESGSETCGGGLWEIPCWDVHAQLVDLTPVIIMKHLERDVRNGGGTRTRRPGPMTQIGLLQPCVRVGKTTSLIDVLPRYLSLTRRRAETGCDCIEKRASWSPVRTPRKSNDLNGEKLVHNDLPELGVASLNWLVRINSPNKRNRK